MKNSSIYYIQDFEEAMFYLMENQPAQILSLDESLPPTQGIMAATILLPPPVAMIAESDGRADEFYMMYTSYLASKDVSDFINAIICFLFAGGNLIIYIPPAFQDSAFIPVLFQHIYEIYGIHIGTKTEPYYYDNNYDYVNFNILYSLNVIDAYTYLGVYPISLLSLSPYDKQAIGIKLYKDIKPAFLPFGNDLDSLDLVLAYFEELRIKLKDNPELRGGLIYAE